MIVGGDFNDPIERVVLEITDQAPEEANAVSAKMQAAVDLLRELYDDHRETLETVGRDPDGARVTKGEWRKACVGRGIYSKSSFYEMVRGAESRGIIKIEEPHVYLQPCPSGPFSVRPD